MCTQHCGNEALQMKLLKRMTACGITVAFAFSMFGSANSVGAEQLDEQTGQSFEFQIVAERQVVNDSLSQCQLTEDELSASTEELLQIVLRSDYLRLAQWQAQMLSSSAEPMEPRYAGFNGYIELLSRDDFETVLTDYVLRASGDSQWGVSEEYTALQSLLKQSSVVNCLSYEAVSSLAQASGDVQTRAMGDDIIDMGTISYTTSGAVLTVGGQSVPVCDPNRELTTDEAASLNAQFASYGATRRSTPTAHYNCHSYAWHWMSTSNRHWIANEDVAIYIRDTATTQVELENVQTGDIVVYYDENGVTCHSAVVMDISGDVMMVQSKWGKAGVYYHAVNNVPENYTGADGQINCNILRYHDYERTYTGENYHEDGNHYFAYVDTCAICDKTVSGWKITVCVGPPCQLPGTLSAEKTEEDDA